MNQATPQFPNRHLVDAFVAKFINPLPGRKTNDVAQRVRHWVDVANDPSTFNPNSTPAELADVRRKARQNVRRLLTRHPEAAAIVAASLQPEVAR